jgi:hypothetical protein
VIHGVLDPSAEIQWVKVQYIDDEHGHDLQDIRDAQVTLSAPNGDVFTIDWFRTQPDFAYGFELTDARQLVPGGTYTLRVRTAAGEVATGTTTVPVYPVPVEEIVPLFRRDRDTLHLVWSSVPLARRYEVVVQSNFPVDGNIFGEQTWRTFSDTSIALAGTLRRIGNDPVFHPGSGAVVVTAVDDNYYTYYHPNVDPFAGAPPSRITGALGVFGSVAPILMRFLEEIR